MIRFVGKEDAKKISRECLALCTKRAPTEEGGAGGRESRELPALATSPHQITLLLPRRSQMPIRGMCDTWISDSDVNSFCCYGLVYLLDSW